MNIASIKPAVATVDPEMVARFHAMIDQLVAKGAVAIVARAETHDKFLEMSEPNLASLRLGMSQVFDDLKSAEGDE